MSPATRQQPPAPPQQAIAIIDPKSVPLARQVFGEDRLDLLKEQVGRGWKQPPTNAELEVIALICQRTRLDVFAKPPQIYFIKRWDKQLAKEAMAAQVSIDGARLLASRSREYLGQVGPQWCGRDGQWRDVWFSEDPPSACRVGVYRRGFREPLWSVALWDEWVQKTQEGGPTSFWRSKPAHMLSIIAERMSLKRAFPAETNEIEIEHAEELQRLEAPALAARYTQIFGTDADDSAYADPPRASQARPIPLRERDVADRITGEIHSDAPAAAAGAVVADTSESSSEVIPSDEPEGLYAECEVCRSVEVCVPGRDECQGMVVCQDDAACRQRVEKFTDVDNEDSMRRTSATQWQHQMSKWYSTTKAPDPSKAELRELGIALQAVAGKDALPLLQALTGRTQLSDVTGPQLKVILAAAKDPAWVVRTFQLLRVA